MNIGQIFRNLQNGTLRIKNPEHFHREHGSGAL